ncbi:MAG: HDIG domain-containing metalloprotein [Syntrophales bacterium]|jgi:putative nucleotidyltransferase with HDIG domain
MIPEYLKLSTIAQVIKKQTKQKKLIPDFAKKIAFQRWASAIFLSAILSLLLTPQLHFSYPEYKAGSVAARDVRADRDFLVEDKASSEQKKMEAIMQIPSVYDYDSDIPRQLKATIAKAFFAAQQEHALSDNVLADTQAISRQTRNILENSLGVSLTDDEFNTLQKYRFAPYIQEAISRIVTRAYSSRLITNQVFTKQDVENGVVIKDIKIQKERTEQNLNAIRNIRTIDISSMGKASDVIGHGREDLGKCVISLTRKLIQPNLVFNRNASERKKQNHLDELKPVFFQVLKDEIIIREGQKITSLDQDKLEAFVSFKGEKYFPNLFVLLGIFLLILSLAIVLFHLAKKWTAPEGKISDIIFLSFTLVFQIALIKTGIFISEAINRALPPFSAEACFYAIPFAAGAMLVGVLINRNIALIFSIFSSCLAAFLFDGKITIMLFSFLGSVTASYRAEYCKQRSSFLKVGFLLGLINCAVIVSLCLLSPLGTVFSTNTIIMLAMGLLGGIVSGIIVAGITPFFESFFDYSTDIRLLELANLNQPIFQRMIMEVPGTYHHSIIVASLAEAAAEAIGANPLLVRVSSYYHDIGKSKKPQYFIENQRNGENRHDKLSPKMSSLIITSHVKDGCELACKAKLGAQITNIIREHHGTSLVSYFYEKAKRDKDESIRSLPESDFRYAGPKPQNKEAGLVLLADVVEASSRALSAPTPARISNLVRERIEKVFMDGQLAECEITLHDLNKIAENFTRILNGIFHQRIDYPDLVIREFNGSKKKTHANYNRKQAETNKH